MNAPDNGTPRAGASLLVAGLYGRCPRCGEGPLFNGYLGLVPACRHCGLKFGGNDTGDGPAFFILLPLGILTALLALVLEVKAEPPLSVHIVLWPIFIALAVGLSLRPVKALMVALQYRYGEVEHER